MLELLIVLSVVEGVLGLIVLAVYLLLIVRSLRRSVGYAAKVSFGVRAIETQAASIGPSVSRINQTLRDVTAALPGIAAKAERATAER